MRNCKLRATVVATAGIVLAGWVASEPVRAQSSAQSKKKVDQITCEDFLAMKPEAQQRIANWLDGYVFGKDQTGMVGFDKFEMPQPVNQLVADCKTSPKDTLMDKVKMHK